MGRATTMKYLPEMVRVFLQKPAEDKWRLLRIVTLSFGIRMMVLVLPFRRLAALLGEQNSEGNKKHPGFDWLYVNTVSRQIKNVSHYVPWTSNCLVQAAVGKILLRKKSIESTVSFGVKKKGRKMEAHAWLTVGLRIVLGGETADQFVEVSSFS